MFSHKLTEQASLRTYFEWFLLTFVAGSVNAGGYLACHRFVSHVTGFATLAGVAVAESNMVEALGALVIPLFFLAGVMISGLLTEKQMTTKRGGQKFAPVMRYVGLILVLITILGYQNFFGPFGTPAVMERDFLLMALLCGACGLQNAAITSASGSTVRTTHLTGLTTDLGLGIIRSEVHKITDHQRSIERRANLLRALLMTSFILGSGVGAFAFVHFHYLGFLMPAALSFYFWFSARGHA